MPDKKYIGSAALGRRYDRTVRTIQRWISDPPAGFPRPIKHHNRWLWIEAELDAYDEANRHRAPEAA